MIIVRHAYLEEEGVLQDPGDIEVIAVSSNTNHQSIVWHLVRVVGV